MEKKKKTRARADELLVERGLAGSIEEARALLLAGVVMARGPDGREERIEKAGSTLHRDSVLRLKDETHPFVSRGGVKLQAALDAFGIDPRDWACADIGVSTGGFTDCLLQRGAARVYGVDVGYGDVAWSIRQDPRVTLFERTNARTLPPLAFKELVRLAVMDVSFISATAILPALIPQLSPLGLIVVLVKPQFELPREDVPAGVVSDPAARVRAVEKVLLCAANLGLEVLSQAPSPIPGRDGNREIFVCLRVRFGPP